jgi:hypothetical protein
MFCVIPVPDRPVFSDRKLVTELWRGRTYFRTSLSWIWSMTAAFAKSSYLHMGAGQLIMSVLVIRVPVRRPLLVGQAAITLQAVPYLLLDLNGGVAAVAAASFVAGLGITFASVANSAG